MYKKSIMLLDANEEVLTELKTVLEKAGKYRVSYAGDDGEAGLRYAMKEKPDMTVVGMFLKGSDGGVVIRSIRREYPETKIIATGVASDGLMSEAMKEGADYYLVKPFTTTGVTERIEELMREAEESKGKEYGSVKKRPVSVEEKISDIFISIGIPPHIKGYGYLREGIKRMVEEPTLINNVTKVLYPGIAEKYGTTSSKVERAIRHAIEVAWNRGRIEAINAIFGTRVYLGTEKPTNSEFIALVADKLILESMM